VTQAKSIERFKTAKISDCSAFDSSRVLLQQV